MAPRPDYSEYVAHFTSGAQIEGDSTRSTLTPRERLASILEESCIIATKKPWGLGGKSVAFTECPWASLLDHAHQYSPYGIGFTKSQLWAAGGQPALYMRSDVLRAIRDHVNESAKRKVYPAVPPVVGTFYTPYEREPGWTRLDGQEVETHIDYSHEREWRVPENLLFNSEDIRFLIVDRVDDVVWLQGRIPAAMKAIGTDKVLVMDVYRKIEQLWPTHRLDT